MPSLQALSRFAPSNWSLGAIATVPLAIAQYVSSAALSVFAKPQPESPREPNPIREDLNERYGAEWQVQEDGGGFHQYLPFEADGKEAGAPPLMGFVNKAGGSVNGKEKLAEIRLSNDEIVRVPQIFLADINRSNQRDRKLLINGVLVVKPEDFFSEDEAVKDRAESELHREVVEKVFNLVGRDPGKLFNILKLASQNISIDGRMRVTQAFYEEYELNPGFNPKYDPASISTSMEILINEEGEKVECILSGKIIGEELHGMDYEFIPYQPPVRFWLTGTYDLNNNDVVYRDIEFFDQAAAPKPPTDTGCIIC